MIVYELWVKTDSELRGVSVSSKHIGMDPLLIAVTTDTAEVKEESFILAHSLGGIDSVMEHRYYGGGSLICGVFILVNQGKKTD